MRSMTTDEKCRIVLERMLEVAKADDIIFRNDSTGNTTTVLIGFGRKNCGAEDASFDEIVNDLYRLFNKNVGVSFVNIHDDDEFDECELLHH